MHEKWGNHESKIHNRFTKTKRREQKHNTNKIVKPQEKKEKERDKKRNTKLMGKQGLKWQ